MQRYSRPSPIGRPIRRRAASAFRIFAKETPWRPKSIVLETDPPLHDRTRKILQRVMSPTAMRRLREDFKRKAVALAAKLLKKGDIDAVRDLAEGEP